MNKYFGWTFDVTNGWQAKKGTDIISAGSMAELRDKIHLREKGIERPTHWRQRMKRVKASWEEDKKRGSRKSP